MNHDDTLTSNGGEAGDPFAYLVADELPEALTEMLALLDCGALIEEEATV